MPFEVPFLILFLSDHSFHLGQHLAQGLHQVPILCGGVEHLVLCRKPPPQRNISGGVVAPSLRMYVNREDFWGDNLSHPFNVFLDELEHYVVDL